jgi:hypothetical protein
MERAFWAMLERGGPRLPHDRYVVRDVWDLIEQGRIGDALVLARQYDRQERWLDLARAALDETDPMEGILDEHGCIPARPKGGNDGVLGRGNRQGDAPGEADRPDGEGQESEGAGAEPG